MARPRRSGPSFLSDALDDLRYLKKDDAEGQQGQKRKGKEMRTRGRAKIDATKTPPPFPSSTTTTSSFFILPFGVQLLGLASDAGCAQWPSVRSDCWNADAATGM